MFATGLSQSAGARTTTVVHSNTMHVNVAVIGAGISGLTAARSVLKKIPEARVAVIEARDRVGGRTCSLPLGDDGVDIG